MTLSGNQKRRMKSASRLYAVQALFQMEARGQSIDAVIAEFETHRFGADVEGGAYIDGDPDLFRETLTAAVDNQVKIDQLTDKALVQAWPLGRIDPTLRAIFRAAIAENIALKTPSKIVVKEYLDVVGAFFEDGAEIKLVNSVLDAALRGLDSAAFD